MVVFVHGVPETHHLWNDVRDALGRDDTIALACPGFGNPRPAGFAATKEAYVDWLVAELEKIGEPVDLVGHDWGGAFTLRVASIRPDLLRSWVSDAAGLADVNFEWHEFAKIWQTPEAGEEFWRRQLAMPLEERAQTFVGFGVPLEKARDLAGRHRSQDGRSDPRALPLRGERRPRMGAGGRADQDAGARRGLRARPVREC
jgi:pimeloyl-ACP methyl ester carboxylesterase